MKEKIDRYAKGIFEYETPVAVLTPSRLEFTAAAGEIYQGSFTVSNTAGRVMKGIVCTDHHDMLLKSEVFHGRSNEISFRFRGTNYQPGDVINGTIQILSDHGRYQLPFTASIAVPSCETSIGKIRDLLQFAELAKENLDEASRIFAEPAFEPVLLSQNEKYQELYHGLLKGRERTATKGLGIPYLYANSMEEFLIAVHKKIRIQLSLEKKELQYPKCEHPFADKLIIQKDTWGYAEYEIQSDADFIKIERSHFRTTDFVGDTYEAGFIIDADAMAPGHNFARITITGIHQTLQAEIIARKYCISDEERRQYISLQQDVGRLYQDLLFFQAGKISEEEYTGNIERLTCSIEALARKENPYDWLLRAFRIRLAMLKHQEEMFHIEMSHLEDQLQYLKKDQPLLYCAYYYLLFLWKPEAAERTDAVGCIRDCYQSEGHHWIMLWFLLQMDASYQSGTKRKTDILDQLQDGTCCSPLLYLELIRLFEKKPEFLTELTPPVHQALHWALVNHLLPKDLKFRYAYLISRYREYSQLMFSDLVQMYQEEETDDLLMMICQTLMRDRRVSADDLSWYQLGIEHDLKLTELYESYMDALELAQETELPEKVLVYFSYKNQLGDSKKALLFEYIIRHKEMDPKTYELYCPSMEEFAREQVLKGKINRRLAVIYEEFIHEETLDEEMARQLPAVLFAREITCKEPSVTEVVIRHRELVQEEHVPLVGGKAVISVFTDSAQIFLADQKGNRYADSVDYTLHQLLHLEQLAGKCLLAAGDHVRLLLHLYERADSLHAEGEDIAELRKRVLGIAGLDPEYRKKVFAIQMKYYFENFEGELLDLSLKEMDWDQVAYEDRGHFIEYCAVRHSYEKGMEGILQFGYDHLDAKRLLQISTLVFERAKEENASLVKLAWYIFDHGQFDGGLLQYLCDYYSGGVPEMVRIWEAAHGFGIDVLPFSERILAQILFTDEMDEAAYQIFFFYEKNGRHKRLIRAFMKQSAYQYLVHGRELPEELLDCFYEHIQVEENFPCLLAVLKAMSKKEHLTGGETVFADYNIHQLYEKNLVPGFFQGFYGKVSLPDRILKEQYVEYIADPAHEVRICYRFLSGDRKGTEVTQKMPDIFEGIRTCGFILFQDDVLEYYIIERSADGTEKRTESRTLHYVDRMTEADGVIAYRILNKMMIAMENGYDDKFLNYMWQYAGLRAATKMLISPLEESE